MNPNNLFKSDSQRVAFLLCVALRLVFKVVCGSNRYCVAHTLTGRYMSSSSALYTAYEIASLLC
ncbi:DUF3265 domain-containing protein [Vibrio anguillarum]|nr:DUF3265 domain-containing protein [Vibrio anguillarum]